MVDRALPIVVCHSQHLPVTDPRQWRTCDATGDGPLSAVLGEAPVAPAAPQLPPAGRTVARCTDAIARGILCVVTTFASILEAFRRLR